MKYVLTESMDVERSSASLQLSGCTSVTSLVTFLSLVEGAETIHVEVTVALAFLCVRREFSHGCRLSIALLVISNAKIAS